MKYFKEMKIFIKKFKIIIILNFNNIFINKYQIMFITKINNIKINLIIFYKQFKI